MQLLEKGLSLRGVHGCPNAYPTTSSLCVATNQALLSPGASLITVARWSASRFGTPVVCT